MAGLLTTVYTIRDDREERRISNLFELTKSHREIWSLLVEKPALARVLDEHADIQKQPISEAERRFVLFLILHLATAFEAQKRGMFVEADGIRQDVRSFFTRPIPHVVWSEVRRYQQSDFVRFVGETVNANLRT